MLNRLRAALRQWQFRRFASKYCRLAKEERALRTQIINEEAEIKYRTRRIGIEENAAVPNRARIAELRRSKEEVEYYLKDKSDRRNKLLQKIAVMQGHRFFEAAGFRIQPLPVYDRSELTEGLTD